MCTAATRLELEHRILHASYTYHLQYIANVTAVILYIRMLFRVDFNRADLFMHYRCIRCGKFRYR